MAEVGEQKTAAARLATGGFEPGTVIDEKLQIDEYLGSGGMCDVFRATHLILHKPVAIKFLKRRLVGDSQHIKRFEREAIILSKLKHPNLVEIFAFGIFDGRPYIAMELLSGRSLAQLLEASPQGKLPADQAVPLFTQICDALAIAHAEGIVHRDLKPSNVMLMENDSLVKVMDFGIAKVLPESGMEIQKLTQTGDLIGSIPYMSPEQCQGNQIDARSDIYSLGCLMYETITGKCAFAGEAPLAVLMKHVEGRVDRQTELETPLGHVILKCLHLSPDDRPASAVSLKAALLDPPRIRKSSNKQKMILGLLSAILLGGLFIAGVFQIGKPVATAPAIESSTNDAAIENAITAEHRYADASHKYTGSELKPIFQNTFASEMKAAESCRSKAMNAPKNESGTQTRLDYLNKAVEFCQKAARLAEENHDRSSYLNAKANEAYMYVEAGELEKPLLSARMVIRNPEPDRDDRLGIQARHMAYRALTATLLSRREFSSCRRQLLDWKEFNTRRPADDDSICVCLDNLGRVTREKKDWQSSLGWYIQLEKSPNAKGYWSECAVAGEGLALMNMARQSSDANTRKELFARTKQKFFSLQDSGDTVWSNRAAQYLEEMRKNKEIN